jgi:hypothetical protein
MTVREVLAHDWQVGEKLWEVYYKYNKEITTGKGIFMTSQPVGIIEVTVTKVERNNPEYSDDFESIRLTLNGDWGFKSTYDNPYSNTIITAMVTHGIYGSKGDRYDHQKFCSDKFFNKEDAEKRFKKVVEQWNKKVKNFQESQKIKLEAAKKQYEALLNKGLIDVENNTINPDI